MDNHTIKCPHCRKSDIVKRGSFNSNIKGKVQRYYCKECNKKFVNRNGFYRMRNSEEKITQSLHLYFSGTSLRKTQEHIGIFHNHNCSYVTILRWIRKYTKIISNTTDNLKLKVGNELMVDEMEHSIKGEQGWFVDVMDTETRYMVSSGLMYGRSTDNMKKVLREAKNKTENQIQIITTDGLLVYPKVLNYTFGLNKIKGKSKIRHNIVIASERGFNHKIERLHNSVRERTKIFRGFGSLESARDIMKGYEIYYNFCRKHQAINKYPYELATDLVLGKNKLLDLIKLSSN